MTFYSTPVGTSSLTRTDFEIFDMELLGFDLDLRPTEVISSQIWFNFSEAHI